LDRLSGAIIKKIRHADPTIIAKVLKSRLFAKHEKRLVEAACPIMFKLWERGIEVKNNPLNIFFDIER